MCGTSLLQADTHPRLHYATDRSNNPTKVDCTRTFQSALRLSCTPNVEISGTIFTFPDGGPIPVVEVVHLAALWAVQSVHRVMVQPSREKKQ